MGARGLQERHCERGLPHLEAFLALRLSGLLREMARSRSFAGGAGASVALWSFLKALDASQRGRQVTISGRLGLITGYSADIWVDRG